MNKKIFLIVFLFFVLVAIGLYKYSTRDTFVYYHNYKLQEASLRHITLDDSTTFDKRLYLLDLAFIDDSAEVNDKYEGVLGYDNGPTDTICYVRHTINSTSNDTLRPCEKIMGFRYSRLILEPSKHIVTVSSATDINGIHNFAKAIMAGGIYDDCLHHYFLYYVDNDEPLKESFEFVLPTRVVRCKIIEKPIIHFNIDVIGRRNAYGREYLFNKDLSLIGG